MNTKYDNDDMLDRLNMDLGAQHTPIYEYIDIQWARNHKTAELTAQVEHLAKQLQQARYTIGEITADYKHQRQKHLKLIEDIDSLLETTSLLD